jgi:hypothetical protein
MQANQIETTVEISFPACKYGPGQCCREIEYLYDRRSACQGIYAFSAMGVEGQELIDLFHENMNAEIYRQTPERIEYKMPITYREVANSGRKEL